MTPITEPWLHRQLRRIPEPFARRWSFRLSMAAAAGAVLCGALWLAVVLSGRHAHPLLLFLATTGWVPLTLTAMVLQGACMCHMNVFLQDRTAEIDAEIQAAVAEIVEGINRDLREHAQAVTGVPLAPDRTLMQ